MVLYASLPSLMVNTSTFASLAVLVDTPIDRAKRAGHCRGRHAFECTIYRPLSFKIIERTHSICEPDVVVLCRTKKRFKVDVCASILCRPTEFATFTLRYDTLTLNSAFCSLCALPIGYSVLLVLCPSCDPTRCAYISTFITSLTGYNR